AGLTWPEPIRKAWTNQPLSSALDPISNSRFVASESIRIHRSLFGLVLYLSCDIGEVKVVYLIKDEPFKMFLLTNFWNSSQIWIRTCTGCGLVQLLFQLLLEPCHYLFFRLGSGYPAEYIPPNSNKIIGRKMEYWIDHFMIECALK